MSTLAQKLFTFYISFTFIFYDNFVWHFSILIISHYQKSILIISLQNLRFLFSKPINVGFNFAKMMFNRPIKIAHIYERKKKRKW